MKSLFIEYPKCSTCQKAKKHLLSQGVSFTARHIVEETPTKAELKDWLMRSGLPIQKFFNTSGNVYKDMQLKDKLLTMNEDEKLALLSQHGMLIKRPLFISDYIILVGYQKESYDKILKEQI